jgi:hypothetical protein
VQDNWHVSAIGQAQGNDWKAPKKSASSLETVAKSVALTSGANRFMLISLLIDY